MIKPEIVDKTLVLTVEGADKIWALKSELRIPLDHITAVRADKDVVKGWWHGFKFPGSNIPGVLTAGTFYQDGKRIFWDTHYPKEAIVISLDHEHYNELIIEVEDPELFVKRMEEKLPVKMYEVSSE